MTARPSLAWPWRGARPQRDADTGAGAARAIAVPEGTE